MSTLDTQVVVGINKEIRYEDTAIFYRNRQVIHFVFD